VSTQTTISSSGIIHIDMLSIAYQYSSPRNQRVLGPVDPETVPEKPHVKTDDEWRVEEARKHMPPLSAMVNLKDIEVRNVFLFDAW